MSGPLESLLAAFCRPVGVPDYPGGTLKTNIDNSLDFLLKTVPQFLDLVRGKNVLDFGCGLGWQATALAHRNIARSIVGLDIRLTELARQNAERYGVEDRVRFTNSLRDHHVPTGPGYGQHLPQDLFRLPEMLEAARPMAPTWTESRNCRG